MYQWLPFILLAQVPMETLGLDCYQWTREWNQSMPSTLNITRPESSAELKQMKMCTVLLQMLLVFGQNKVRLELGGTGEAELMLTGDDQLIKQYMKIWLSTLKMEQRLELFCFESSACVDGMKDVYDNSK
jgi:hypothetical protein